jgi:[ribosomal protein S18]-alanine N-acetyltransferase
VTASGYLFRPMSEEHAREIAAWHYGAPYDFYDTVNDPDDLAELLDPQQREGAYFSAFDERGALVGFFQFEKKGQSVEVGLGLRPDLTGRGLGLGFLLAGLEFARRRFSPASFRLSVATFNERAILVYERAGFRRVKVFMHHTNGGEHPFLLMTREA